MDKEVYLRQSLEQIPRLLGLLNTNPSSYTYGCFDRDYWHYTCTDFACARKQEAVLTLALLYNTPGKLNPYYHNPHILEWIDACLSFWIKIQQKDGSFNEWYPNEHSFVATSFSAYAVSEAMLIIKEKLPSRKKAVDALAKAGKWLIKHDEGRVQNQEAGAALALLNISLITRKKEFRKSAEKKIELLMRTQTEEGWWHEYGGPDIGYLSLTIDYLVKYYKKTNDAVLLGPIRKSVDFISYFIHPNFTFGGAYGTRNTEYLIPSGFEYLSDTDIAAKSVSSAIRMSLSNGDTVGPKSLDDRYLCYILYNWLQSYTELPEKRNRDYNIKARKNRYSEIFKKSFPIAKIAIISTEDIYLIINYSKGGAFKLFFKNSSTLSYDSGILVSSGNRFYTSSALSKENRISFGDSAIRIHGRLSRADEKLLSPHKNVILRLFQLTLGRSSIVNMLIKERLRDKLISDFSYSNGHFRREFIIRKGGLDVADSVSGLKLPQKVYLSLKYSCIYTPSSKYFQISDISSKNIVLDGLNARKVIRHYSSGGVDYETIKGG